MIRCDSVRKPKRRRAYHREDGAHAKAQEHETAFQRHQVGRKTVP